MIECRCTDDNALACCGGGLPRRGAFCSCRCHAEPTHAALIADAHREARATGRLALADDAAMHLAWLRAHDATRASGRPS